MKILQIWPNCKLENLKPSTMHNKLFIALQHYKLHGVCSHLSEILFVGKAHSIGVQVSSDLWYDFESGSRGHIACGRHAQTKLC